MPKPAITTLSALSIVPSSTNNNNGFYAPQLTAAQITAIPATTLRNGAIVYNTTLNFFQVYVNGAWNFLNSGAAAGVAGVGLVAGSPLVVPSGTANAVEVNANEVPGFMYYNTTTNTFKVRTNDDWLTITIE
jgi:hypothetical protein